MKTKIFRNTYLFLLIIFSSSVLQAQNSPEITSNEIKEHINFLASDELKGRLTGSNEIKIAGEYIKNEFESYGLRPVFGNSFFQEFKFISGIKTTENNSISFSINNKKQNLILNQDFVTAPFSGKVNIDGKVVFAGYGISSAKINYDDYLNLDVKGKIVIVFRGNPESGKPKSKFDEFSSIRYKTSVARDKGAFAIIFLNGYFPADENDAFIPIIYDMAPGLKDIGAVQVKRKIIEDIFQSFNINLSDIQKKINETTKPNSFELNNLNIRISTEIIEVEKTCRNVSGMIEGKDSDLKNEYVVIGAHYDHLGMGEISSLYRGTEKIVHNGADDNASGTSGVLELAEKFASLNRGTKRSIIFITFSGEEYGLLGSNYFVNNLPVPANQIVAMFNMDMIGRMDTANSMIVYGTGTSPIWKDILKKENEFNFHLTFNDEGFGPSDQSSFYGKNIPVLFFFTGTHSDYHRPSDDAEKINSVGEEKILKYIFSIANDVVESTPKPEFVKSQTKENEKTGGWKVYVGTVPDFSYQGEGFKISGVNNGSPAQKGGMLAGDIMLSFGGKLINNIYDYVYALQEHLPGDEVEVIIKRNNEKISLKLILGMK